MRAERETTRANEVFLLVHAVEATRSARRRIRHAPRTEVREEYHIPIYIYMCVCVCVCGANQLSNRLISIVASFHGMKLCTLAARAFRSQQNGSVTRMCRRCQMRPSRKERAIGAFPCKKEGMLLRQLGRRSAACAVHHEQDVRWEQHVLNVPRAINNRVCARRASSIVTCCHSVKLCVHDLRFTTKHWLARHTHSLMVVYSVVVCTRFAINILKHHWCWTSLLLFKSRPYWPRNRLGKRKKKVSPRCPRWSSAHLMNVISRWAFSYPLRLGNCVITKAWTDLCIVTVNYSRLGGLKRVFQKPSIH